MKEKMTENDHTRNIMRVAHYFIFLWHYFVSFCFCLLVSIFKHKRPTSYNFALLKTYKIEANP